MQVTTKIGQRRQSSEWLELTLWLVYFAVVFLHASESQILVEAESIFHNSGAKLSGKVIGIHWNYLTRSHAPELTTGSHAPDLTARSYNSTNVWETWSSF